jgi:hypothetical protein
VDIGTSEVIKAASQSPQEQELARTGLSWYIIFRLIGVATVFIAVGLAFVGGSRKVARNVG